MEEYREVERAHPDAVLTTMTFHKRFRNLACELSLALAVGLVLQEVVDVRNQRGTGFHHFWVKQQLERTQKLQTCKQANQMRQAKKASHQKHTQTNLQVRIQVFFSFLQEISVHVVEGLFSGQLQDRSQVLKLKQRFETQVIARRWRPR